MIANIVVEKDGDRWAVKREGTDVVLSSHMTHEEAMANARYLGEQGGVEVKDETGR
jgi:Uncharacterized protein conserved in bacteria (DUF2188)